MLGFYKTSLSNSAGGSMSYVGDGAIKTVNFSADANQGMVQYMKCSEMPIGASIWNRDIGKTIYQTLLDRVVTVEDNKGNRTNINPYDKFMENIKHDGYITQRNLTRLTMTSLNTYGTPPLSMIMVIRYAFMIW